MLLCFAARLDGLRGRSLGGYDPVMTWGRFGIITLCVGSLLSLVLGIKTLGYDPNGGGCCSNSFHQIHCKSEGYRHRSPEHVDILIVVE